MTTIRFERFEYKYFLPVALVEGVRRFIAPYVLPDAHQGGRYRVSNLYLDTPDFEFYREHLRGAQDRFKLRLRSYDGPEVFLEVKRKIKNVVVKSRAPISRERLAALLDEGELLPLEGLPGGPLEEFRGRAILHGVRPVVLLDYQREAYESVFDDDARITLDRGIRYRPASELDFAADDAGWRHVDGAQAMGGVPVAIMLELKFATACPAWMVDLVRTFNLERHSFSKYLAAMTDHLDPDTGGREWENVSLLGVDDE